MDRSQTLAALHATLRVQALQTVLLHSAVAARLGIAVTDFNCINLLSMEGPLPAGTLADRLGLTRGGAVTAMIDRLETAGYVRRRRDETDRRRVLVELDPDAAQRIAPMFASLGAALDDHVDPYSAGDLRLLLDFVSGVNARVADATAQLRASRLP